MESEKDYKNFSDPFLVDLSYNKSNGKFVNRATQEKVDYLEIDVKDVAQSWAAFKEGGALGKLVCSKFGSECCGRHANCMSGITCIASVSAPDSWSVFTVRIRFFGVMRDSGIFIGAHFSKSHTNFVIDCRNGHELKNEFGTLILPRITLKG